MRLYVSKTSLKLSDTRLKTDIEQEKRRRWNIMFRGKVGLVWVWRLRRKPFVITISLAGGLGDPALVTAAAQHEL